MRIKTDLLLFVLVSENFFLLFGLNWNLMLNGKHKDLPKFVFSEGKKLNVSLDRLQ